jgi:predicted Zn-dependent protease
MNEQTKAERFHRLLDAQELVELGKRAEALAILRTLIREDKDFEEAWLWMSVVAETVDQSVVCLDNVLRINPKNQYALGALYKLREGEMKSEMHRAKIRSQRDMSLGGVWLLSFILLFAILFSAFTRFG